eukprot:337338-Rhodomonas_salina.1
MGALWLWMETLLPFMEIGCDAAVHGGSAAMYARSAAMYLKAAVVCTEAGLSFFSGGRFTTCECSAAIYADVCSVYGGESDGLVPTTDLSSAEAETSPKELQIRGGKGGEREGEREGASALDPSSVSSSAPPDLPLRDDAPGSERIRGQQISNAAEAAARDRHRGMQGWEDGAPRAGLARAELQAAAWERRREGEVERREGATDRLPPPPSL